MSQSPVAKALIVSGFLAFTAVGLYAADAYRPVSGAVEIAPQPGPAIQREADAIATPRECDNLRGIDRMCTYQ